ncbi:prolyl 4-hydroxylase 1-like isoform X2 [Salvia miltiorrhiza]|uniref:prolyl 4-hydroxylase 1-like isoform X2 n=1 Tax=Salvia miltiorrhiza TaxID=226208 RepID=UPI0025AD4B28|nr:prolyl 4-hydroxylase 1-like isoform X2 [Salvia miltiorrhiza]
MAASSMRFIFIILTFVTVGMIFGALLQLAFIRRLEESSGAKSSLTRIQHLNGGISYWDDKEASVLRLGYVKPEVVSWSPRIVVFHNFLSDEECDYLRAISKPRLEVSTVVDARTGKGIKSKVRTSSGMFLTAEERKFPMIQAIEKRISVYAQVPVENGERIQVLRYEKNQFYRPHHDYFSDTFNLKYGGQRVGTVLMYLSDNVEGGETYFPKAGSGECSCGGKMAKGLCVKPIKGDAVLFWSMGLDGKSDPNSLHGGCEVLSGEKWSATKWMRQSATV